MSAWDSSKSVEENERLAAAERADEMCEHMLALVAVCKEVGVTFHGCGDCGSPWLTCKTCDLTVDNAGDVFTEGRRRSDE